LNKLDFIGIEHFFAGESSASFFVPPQSYVIDSRQVPRSSLAGEY
jgi:hypothetical protein